MNEFKTIRDFILPFREEDNKAWERANMFGRIFFPIYIVAAACRTIMFWLLLIAFSPVPIIVAIVESKAMKSMSEWIERVFKAIFCKP